MSNPTVILNGDQVYCDELIRENARLTIQHEADRLTLEQMRKQCISSEECTAKVAEAYARADKAKRDAEALNSKLRQAVADLHFVMAGGDACKVCAVECAFFAISGTLGSRRGIEVHKVFLHKSLLLFSQLCHLTTPSHSKSRPHRTALKNR